MRNSFEFSASASAITENNVVEVYLSGENHELCGMTMTQAGEGEGEENITKSAENENQFGTPVTFTVIQRTVGELLLLSESTLPVFYDKYNRIPDRTYIINFW